MDSMYPIQKVEILRACCCVAGADGKSTEQERQLLQRLADGVGVGKASLDAMIDRAESDPAFYEEQFRILKADPPGTMALLFETALADGKIEQTEVDTLRGLAENLEVPEDVFTKLVERAATMRTES